MNYHFNLEIDKNVSGKEKLAGHSEIFISKILFRIVRQSKLLSLVVNLIRDDFWKNVELFLVT